MKYIQYILLLFITNLSLYDLIARSIIQTKYDRTLEIFQDENWVIIFDGSAAIGKLRIWPGSTVVKIDWIAPTLFEVTINQQGLGQNIEMIVLKDPLDAQTSKEYQECYIKCDDATAN